MYITEIGLRRLIRQIIKESYYQENLDDDKKTFLNLFAPDEGEVNYVDEDRLHNELVKIGHLFSITLFDDGRLDGYTRREDAYSVKLYKETENSPSLRGGINAQWRTKNDYDKKGYGLLAIRAKPYSINQVEPDYLVIVKANVINNQFKYEIISYDVVS